MFVKLVENAGGGAAGMRMKMDGGWLYVIEANDTQTAAIKSSGLMKWSRKDEMWSGPASMELLDRMARMVPLPRPIEEERRRLHRMADAVEEERKRPDAEVVPYVPMPVKKKLYTHQVRAVNMCLLVFGVVVPEEALREVMKE